jgi:formate dehydrogenase major subunit
MNVSRRGFLKLSGAVAAVSGLGISLTPASARAQQLKIKYAKETTTVCPYCSVGCSIIVSVRDGKVVNTEGDPDSPINKGSLCSKGGSIYQMAVNENRLGKPLYRAPFATEWKEVEWEWAFEKIAENVKKSRDASFKKTNAKGELVNRTEGIASVGSAAIGTGDRSRAPRAASPSRKRRKGARLARKASPIANSATGKTINRGSTSPIWISRPATARWTSGSATVRRTEPCKAASL